MTSSLWGAEQFLFLITLRAKNFKQGRWGGWKCSVFWRHLWTVPKARLRPSTEDVNWGIFSSRSDWETFVIGRNLGEIIGGGDSTIICHLQQLFNQSHRDLFALIDELNLCGNKKEQFVRQLPPMWRCGCFNFTKIRPPNHFSTESFLLPKKSQPFTPSMSTTQTQLMFSFDTLTFNIWFALYDFPTH